MLRCSSYRSKYSLRILCRVPLSKVFHMLSVPANYLRRVSTVLVLGVCLCACAGTDPQPEQRVGTAPSTGTASRVGAGHSQAQLVAAVALRQVGVPYRYGGSDPGGFDCSGLVQYAYAHAGRSLPRTTGGLWQELDPVAGNALEVGDVLFFSIDGKMSHVGVYIGQNRFVHAPSSGKQVATARLDSAYYRRAFVRGGRPR